MPPHNRLCMARRMTGPRAFPQRCTEWWTAGPPQRNKACIRAQFSLGLWRGRPCCLNVKCVWLLCQYDDRVAPVPSDCTGVDLISVLICDSLEVAQQCYLATQQFISGLRLYYTARMYSAYIDPLFLSWYDLKILEVCFAKGSICLSHAAGPAVWCDCRSCSAGFLWTSIGR